MCWYVCIITSQFTQGLKTKRASGLLRSSFRKPSRCCSTTPTATAAVRERGRTRRTRGGINKHHTDHCKYYQVVRVLGVILLRISAWKQSNYELECVKISSIDSNNRRRFIRMSSWGSSFFLNTNNKWTPWRENFILSRRFNWKLLTLGKNWSSCWWVFNIYCSPSAWHSLTGFVWRKNTPEIKPRQIRE